MKIHSLLVVGRLHASIFGADAQIGRFAATGGFSSAKDDPPSSIIDENVDETTLKSTWDTYFAKHRRTAPVEYAAKFISFDETFDAVGMIPLNLDMAVAYAGHVPAQRVLAKRYRSGIGVSKDIKESMSWFATAAEEMDPYSVWQIESDNDDALFDYERGEEFMWAATLKAAVIGCEELERDLTELGYAESLRALDVAHGLHFRWSATFEAASLVYEKQMQDLTAMDCLEFVNVVDLLSYREISQDLTPFGYKKLAEDLVHLGDDAVEKLSRSLSTLDYDFTPSGFKNLLQDLDTTGNLYEELDITPLEYEGLRNDLVRVANLAPLNAKEMFHMWDRNPSLRKHMVPGLNDLQTSVVKEFTPSDSKNLGEAMSRMYAEKLALDFNNAKKEEAYSTPRQVATDKKSKKKHRQTSTADDLKMKPFSTLLVIPYAIFYILFAVSIPCAFWNLLGYRVPLKTPTVSENEDLGWTGVVLVIFSFVCAVVLPFLLLWRKKKFKETARHTQEEILDELIATIEPAARNRKKTNNKSKRGPAVVSARSTIRPSNFCEGRAAASENLPKISKKGGEEADRLHHETTLERLHADAKRESAEAIDQAKRDAEIEMAVQTSYLETKMSSKKKTAQPDADECANCETVGTKLTCAKCKLSRYCSEACQEQHWIRGHRERCFSPEERLPLSVISRGVSGKPWNPRGAQDDDGGNSDHCDDECPVCLESVSGCTVCTLPCKHTFHLECIDQLRKQDVGSQKVCPLCRTAFSVGTEKLPDNGANGGKVQQLVALTRMPEAECLRMLTAEGFDVERACNTFFNGYGQY